MTIPPINPTSAPYKTFRNGKVVPGSERDQLDPLADVSGRARLAGFVQGHSGAMAGVIEWLDDTYHVQQQFSFAQLVDLGFTIVPRADGVMLTHPGGATEFVSAWPIDPVGKVAQVQSQSINTRDQRYGIQ
ncbi:hypothetical protein [Andreprevotia lacus]|uniref:hypothetical protein n=1 Tax=Andreprevotia lacus TaxID=1121000 RepID=UPI00111BF7F7|nr:hypothetical protein [Andreprevotia lacus]